MISLAPKIVGETWLDVTLIFLIVLIMMALVPIIFRVMWFSNYKRTLRKKAASYTPPTKSKWKGKTFLCYVNPVGGNRIGRFVLEKVVKPMMESAGINLHVVFTEYPEHASEHVQSVNLDSFSAIVSLGGDGMIHQLLNGLSKRKEVTDRESFKKLLTRIPLATIPTGTCNGIASSFYGCADAFIATRNIIEGDVKPLDVAHIVYDGKELYDAHVISWACTAAFDDIVENKLRWLGGLLRSSVTFWAAIYMIIRAPTFKGRVRFKPIPVDSEYAAQHGYSDLEKNTIPDNADPEMRVIEADFNIFTAINLTHAAHDAIFSTGASPSDGAFDLVILRSCSRLSLLKVFLNFEDGSHVHNPVVEIYKTDWCEIIPLDASNRGILDTSGECFPFPEKLTITVHNGMGMWISK